MTSDSPKQPASGKAAKPDNVTPLVRPQGQTALKQDRPIAVLKFGHTIIPSEAAVTVACTEIYRHLREGWQVVATVSAIGEETSELIDLGRSFTDMAEPEHLPRLLRIGEFKSAALLCLGLSRIGVSCCALDPYELGLKAEGRPLDSDLTEIDVSEGSWFRKMAAIHDVIVAPGFLANSAEGAVVTLGRGGTDATAVYIANAIKAPRLRLLKDVDGVYRRDPNLTEEPVERFVETDWETVGLVGGGVVQEKTLKLAESLHQQIEVAAVGRDDFTLIHGAPSKTETPVTPKKLKVALLGFGVVGRGVFAHLQMHSDYFEVSKILVRNLDRHKDAEDAQDLLTTDMDEVLKTKPDIVVELMGGIDGPGAHISAALKADADIVTANKTLMAYKFNKMTAAKDAAGREIRYSAAVAGGIPVLETVDRLVKTGDIAKVEALLNGTSNFILDELAAGAGLASSIKLAQERGFAEADPSADIDGKDAAEKLALIARHAFGAEPDPKDIESDSLSSLADGAVKAAHDAGRAIKQIACVEKTGDGVRLSVKLQEIDGAHPLASARGEQNKALITMEDGRLISVAGKGAGRWPTSESVFGDIMDLWRLRACTPSENA